MLDSFFLLLQNLPFGLLLAALLLDAFIVVKNRAEVEPAVLWLLFCAICASGVVILVTLGMFFFSGDATRLHDGGWGLVLSAVASMAWYFKRQGRNRGVLSLKERFYGPDPKEAPKPKPGQYFWILGWRVLAVLSLAAGLGGLLRLKPEIELSKYDTAKEPAPAAAAPSPVPAATDRADTAAATPAPAETGAPAVPAVAAETPPASADSDPTRSEIPSAEASEEAARMVAGTMNATPASEPVVTPPAPPPAETARPVSRNSVYFSKIRPILVRNCVKCHGAEKQKGDLALHTPDAIRAGINGKPAIVPGDPEKSRIYACVILPPDDPDFMPQKGQPLGVTDKKTLFEWIKAGADLGDGVSIPGGGGGNFVVDAIAGGVPDFPQALMESLAKEHVLVRPLSKNKRVVEIDFSHSDRASGDLKLAELVPVALNIYGLDFSRTKVTDADLAHLSGMRNLSRLILSKTGITDAGLSHLRNNIALEQLNLYNTMVTDAGLVFLEPLKALKKVYLWGSKVTGAGAKQLSDAVPGVSVSLGTMPATPRLP